MSCVLCSVFRAWCDIAVYLRKNVYLKETAWSAVISTCVVHSTKEPTFKGVEHKFENMPQYLSLYFIYYADQCGIIDF